MIPCDVMYHMIPDDITTDGGGHRTRSNTAVQLPSWLRKKRESSRKTSLQSAIAPGSIEELFTRFSRLATANMQQEPLAKFIVGHCLSVFPGNR